VADGKFHSRYFVGCDCGRDCCHLSLNGKEYFSEAFDSMANSLNSSKMCAHTQFLYLSRDGEKKSK
jgi:hypothetical protein